VAWEGEVWLFFKARRWDFLIFQGIILLVVWDDCLEKVDKNLFIYLFWDMGT